MTRQIRIKQKYKKSIFEEGKIESITFKIENRKLKKNVILLKILLLKNHRIKNIQYVLKHINNGFNYFSSNTR